MLKKLKGLLNDAFSFPVDAAISACFTPNQTGGIHPWPQRLGSDNYRFNNTTELVKQNQKAFERFLYQSKEFQDIRRKNRAKQSTRKPSRGRH